MPNTHCGKHNKLSKTMGSPLDTMEEIISSQCPLSSGKPQGQTIFILHVWNSYIPICSKYRLPIWVLVRPRRLIDVVLTCAHNLHLWFEQK